MIRITSLALIAGLVATSAAAREPLLAQPIDCVLGETCFLQALFDHDPTGNEGDAFCGEISRDDHGGTDFALRNLADMRAGVDVIAAAPGTVVGTRDTMPDISRKDPNAPDLNGQDCGNGVAIRHGSGWVTQYCHLKLGTIAVQTGDRVAKGAVLGEVGLSGATSFPHLHLSVFKDGEKVDPYAPDGPTCGAKPPRSMWEDPLPFTPGGFLAAGFAARVPSFDEMTDDLETENSLSSTKPIVVWVSGYQTFPGDRLDVIIAGPAGLFHENSITFDKEQETWQRFTGRKFTTTPWAKGRYTAALTLRRAGEVIVTDTLTASVD